MFTFYIFPSSFIKICLLVGVLDFQVFLIYLTPIQDRRKGLNMFTFYTFSHSFIKICLIIVVQDRLLDFQVFVILQVFVIIKFKVFFLRNCSIVIFIRYTFICFELRYLWMLSSLFMLCLTRWNSLFCIQMSKFNLIRRMIRKLSHQ